MRTQIYPSPWRRVSLVLLLVGGAMAAAVSPVAASPWVAAARCQPADPPENDETPIAFEQAPKAVQAAALTLTDAKSIGKITREGDEDDEMVYEVEYTRDGVACSATFSRTGEIMELEHEVAQAKLPAAVLESLKEELPGATFEKPVAVTKMYYEIQVVEGGKQREIKIDPSGEIHDDHAGQDEQDANDSKDGNADQQGQHHSKANAPDDFRSTFDVAKSDLGPTGLNPFFILQPGTRHTYQEGKVTLTISVLDATRMVDGVMCRVVEEREEAGGKPKELSRNYFAIDAKTNDVYYFGEEVDEYDAAGNVSHPGAWISGLNGAHFGLFMPGEPKVGQKFYQELAPGIAMDRFEIVGVDAKVKTPAGTFERCVQTEETSPLEKGKSSKWFSRGTGLVKDGDAELTGVHIPK